MKYYLSKERLLTLLADKALTRLEKLLLILFLEDQSPKAAKNIQELAYENGLREAKKWNISDILSKSKGKATSLKAGWVLTTDGIGYLTDKNLISKSESIAVNEIEDLKNHALKINNPQTKAFVDEAIVCLESNLLRASIVLSWVGAISLLYDDVVANHLAGFNSEATRRDSKWKIAKTSDDLARMKEAEFLNVIEALSIIGKNVKQELEQCLKLRNGSGHPNSLAFGLRKVAAHLEILILNIFSKF